MNASSQEEVQWNHHLLVSPFREGGAWYGAPWCLAGVAERYQIKGTAGTSAGAIVAALCAANYPPGHALHLFKNLEWPEILNPQIISSYLSI